MVCGPHLSPPKKASGHHISRGPSDSQCVRTDEAGAHVQVSAGRCSGSSLCVTQALASCWFYTLPLPQGRSWEALFCRGCVVPWSHLPT